MRRETRDEAIMRANAASEASTVLSIALTAVVNDELSAPVKTRGGTMRYTARVGQLERAHGGILVLTGTVADQRPDTTAHYVETWLADTRTRTLPHMTMDAEGLAFAKLVEGVATLVYALRTREAS